LVITLAESILNAFTIPNPQDITIYKRIYDNSKYITIFKGFDGEASIKDIINMVQ
jgi:hypothetical protein